MKYKALSIVFPSGQKIANGEKTLEIRSWIPDHLPLKDLVIVENRNFLNHDSDEEEGIAIAIVDIEAVDLWTQDDINAACATYWDRGYYAWGLSNVRSIQRPIQTIAKRKIYEIELDLN